MADIFGLYLIIYTIVAFGYLWYRYIFIIGGDGSLSGNYAGKVSVVIPFYNENPDLLEKTVLSAYNCDGEKEIIIVDDGSPNKEAYMRMKTLQKKIPFQLIRYKKNKGKRHAQSIGFEKANGEIIMTLDSDTLLRKDAIVNLIRPFSDESVGAATGQLEVLNCKKNFITRLQNARYWNAFNFERKSQSKLGAVLCCSGPISAYRTKIIMEILDDYKSQNFMGGSCTYGDDRHLTTLILKNDYKVRYVESAVGYTNVPETWFKFIKQQVRWKKSWLRETYFVSKFMFKKNKAISFEVVLTTFITFFSIFARVGLVVSLILSPLYILYVLPMLAFMGSLHSLYLLFNKKKYFLYSVLYSFVHAFLIYWLVFVAMFTLKNTGWGTR